jgi:FtsP/CotA-like multicopper oxidase with cupredoxin domain
MRFDRTILRPQDGQVFFSYGPRDVADRSTAAENAAIEMAVPGGDRVNRLVNEMDSDHPMHHPFHVHGAGRFLVLARDGVTEPNLVWKDTVLVRTGMMFSFTVEREAAGGRR